MSQEECEVSTFPPIYANLAFLQTISLFLPVFIVEHVSSHCKLVHTGLENRPACVSEVSTSNKLFLRCPISAIVVALCDLTQNNLSQAKLAFNIPRNVVA